MKTFLDGAKPLVAMIQCPTAEACIRKIGLSAADGAEAFGVQLCVLNREERTDEKLRAIFDACGDKPAYVTSYRYHQNLGLTDEECAALLLKALDAGATLCDIPGDLFAQNDFQMTGERGAVRKQRELIDTIHRNGGEALISTHDFRDLSGDEIFRIASMQNEHGADVLKIVVRSADEKRLPEYIAAITRVNEELQKPFLLLDGGACANVLRKVGPFFGTCMYLCVQSHGELDTSAQPVLKALKQIRDHMRP